MVGTYLDQRGWSRHRSRSRSLLRRRWQSLLHPVYLGQQHHAMGDRHYDRAVAGRRQNHAEGSIPMPFLTELLRKAPNILICPMKSWTRLTGQKLSQFLIDVRTGTHMIYPSIVTSVEVQGQR